MASDENTCSICWDDFKNPKILFCRHTFCCKCLKGHHRKHARESNLKCPLCRHEWPYPKGGADEYMNNFFVSNSLMTRAIEPAICACCGQGDIVKECAHCTQQMCSECAASHQEALRIAGDKKAETAFEDEANDDTEDSDSEQDGSPRRRDSNISLPLQFLLSLPTIKTKIKIKLVSKFSVNVANIDVGDRAFVNAICPVSDNEAWVIPFAGPNAILFNAAGEIKGHFSLGGIMTCMVPHFDGTFLISLWTDKAIVKYKPSDNIVMGFANTRNINPHSVCAYPDGRVVYVGAKDNHNKHKGIGEEEEDITETKCRGKLITVTETGDYRSTISSDRHGHLFVNPSSVVVNTVNNTIAVADRGKACVYVFDENGTLLNTYKGGERTRLLFFQEEILFMPLTLCLDREGKILVVDSVNKLIHVLCPSGTFLGIMRPSVWHDLGSPFSIGVDKNDKIWIGDEFDKSVRIFETEEFFNHFEKENQTMN